ncbi:TNT domain-containing protein [Streptacidiphilus sp. N1-3]|uniref:TNT domain-containing protein n=1 Tax=Streptacidiphilus alkalitolerans TaxID=3342712 RepID=A0ABV6WY91_9ACTN
MHIRRTAAALIAAGALLLGTALGAGSAQAAGTAPGAAPALSSGTPLDQCSAAFHDNDSRLGPAQLPLLGRVGLELLGYHRSGSLSESALLATYYSPTANSGSPGWIYPPDNGYLLTPGGRPIETTQTLRPGTDIDRYGSEYGSFLAPEGLPYAARSIPPSSLDSTPAASCNYRDYRVLKPFTVDAGPIAPWFGQPGLGWQYQLDAALVPGAPTPLNVLWLVNNGYLGRL